MPTLELEITVKIHFDYYRESSVNQEVIDITEIETPSEKDIEEWIWEAQDEWKED